MGGARARKFRAFPPKAVLGLTDNKSRAEHIAARVKQVAGRNVAAACDGSVKFRDGVGRLRAYAMSDVNYDLRRGFLTLMGKS